MSISRYIQSKVGFYKNVYKFGIRYWYDLKFRKKCRNKKVNDRAKKLYKSGYLSSKKHIKYLLLKRDKRKCFWCNKYINYDATIDHIIPVTSGGKSDLSNLRLIHNECRIERDRNIAKGILKLN